MRRTISIVVVGLALTGVAQAKFTPNTTAQVNAAIRGIDSLSPYLAKTFKDKRGRGVWHCRWIDDAPTAESLDSSAIIQVCVLERKKAKA